MIRRIVLKVCAWTLLTLACAVFVGTLAGQLRAQTPGCYVIDRFGQLCIPSTGEIFVDVARGGDQSRPLLMGIASPALSTPTSTPHPSTATPRIILAHQKLASDAWIDRSKNKKGERCCDAGKDCHSVMPERIQHTPSGVTVTLDDGRTLFIPGQEIMPSEDGRYWLCYWGGQARCFFAPYSGS